MATYAAYRHVELDKVGCGKRRIMKPPGGDSHDIFGADFHGTPSHHRVLKPPGGGTSQLFATTTEDKPKPQNGQSTQTPASNGVEALNGKTGNDSDSVPLQKEEPQKEFVVKNDTDLEVMSTQSSNLSAEIKQLSALEEKRQRASVTRNCVTGEGCSTTDHYAIRVHRQRDGNPVTGEGYDSTDIQPAPPARTRIPPGGYSSGLW